MNARKHGLTKMQKQNLSKAFRLLKRYGFEIHGSSGPANGYYVRTTCEVFKTIEDPDWAWRDNTGTDELGK